MFMAVARAVWRALAGLVLAMLVLALAGCATYHTQAPRLVAADGSLQKTWYDAEVKAADGSLLRMTVYQPALRPGQRAPLLLHAHGLGLSRMERPFSLYGKLLLAGKSALRAWDEGFWVISYDFRGQGDSGGRISLMDPDKEVHDVSTIIDWAQANLAIADQGGRPRIGMIGESYGGGVQLAASEADPRLRALVPITTWFNLDNSLFPNGVPKTDWQDFLMVVVYTRSPFSMDNAVTGAAFGETFGKRDAALHQRLYRNSPASGCAAGHGPQADALFVQGMRDVLFPLNEALAGRACVQQAGHDARLIAVEHGHLLPGSQWSPGLPVWHVQDEVRCAGRVYRTEDIIDDWLRGKLTDDAAALARVPAYCVTGEAAVDAAPPVLSWQELPPVRMHNGLTGWLEWLAQPLDDAINALAPECLPAGYRPPLEKRPQRGGPDFVPPAACVPTGWQQPEDGWLRPARVPLLAVSRPTWIVGVPRVSLRFSASSRPDATVFLRLAAWRPHSGSYRVLSQQVTPARADGPAEFDLAAVRERLAPGEVLGLLVQGHSNQFRLGGRGWGTAATTVAGRIGLPLAAAGE